MIARELIEVKPGEIDVPLLDIPMITDYEWLRRGLQDRIDNPQKYEDTENAEEDLRDIYEYIAFTLLVPEAAKNLVGKIMKEVSELNEMPLRFPLYKNEPWKSKGLRCCRICGGR